MFTLITAIVVAFLCNCTATKNNTTIVEGDLYFSFFRFGSFYHQPDSIVKKMTAFVDSVNLQTIDSADKKMVEMYNILKQENLLYQPFIDLKLDNDTIIKLYFVSDDYQKITVLKQKELVDASVKVRVKAAVKDLGMGMFLCSKFLSVKKVKGQTLQQMKKFKIEDYE